MINREVQSFNMSNIDGVFYQFRIFESEFFLIYVKLEGDRLVAVMQWSHYGAKYKRIYYKQYNEN